MLKKLVIAAFLLATLGIAANVTVRQGDTLGSLSLRYNTTVTTLTKLNRLTTSSLKIGQQLRLPENAMVVVQAGDTFEGIAARLGVNVTALQRANNLSGDVLRTNQTLRLPSSSTNVANGSAASSSSNRSAVSKTVIYTVRAGDTLSAVAARFKVSIAAVQSASGLRSDALILGQQLRIPTAGTVVTTSAATQKPVTVKPIAVVKPLPKASVVKPSTEKPNSTMASSGIVTVKRGDTLSSIARASGSSLAGLRKLNNLSSDALALGQRLRTGATPTAKSALKPVSSAATTAKPSAVTLTVSSKPSGAEPAVTAKPVTVSKPSVIPRPAPAAMDSSAIGVMPTAPSDVLEGQIDFKIVEPINPPAQINRFERPLWPISGILTSRYGYRWGRLHTGLDIAVPTGTSVYAALSGTVQFAGWNRFGYGYLVVIRGVDSRLYYYAHNSRLFVRVGQFVPQGRMISKSGSTGNSTGPHLHFEVRVGGVARNPLAYLPSSQVLQARYAGK